MRRWILIVAVAVMFADPSPAAAQIVVGPLGPPRFRAVFPAAAGVGFSYQRRGLWVGGFAGGFFARSVFVAPAVPLGFGFGSLYVGPGWGIGPGFGVPLGFAGLGLLLPGGFVAPPVFLPPFAVAPPVFLPPFAVAPPLFVPPVLLGQKDPDGGPDRGAVMVADARREPAAAPPLLRRGDFLVIEPRRDAGKPAAAVAVGPGAVGGGPVVNPMAVGPVPVNPVAGNAVAGAERPVFAFNPFAPRVAVEAEAREAEPAKEAARLMKLGRDAFAAGDYGRAGELFDRAAAVTPGAALPRFLKAQAAFAAGTYGDAVAAIREGLRLDPHWPAGTFDPKEPYGANPAAFATHLAELRKVVAAHPAEPIPAFLLGYQLWFIGERAEAKRWFDVVARGRAAPAPVALFR